MATPRLMTSSYSAFTSLTQSVRIVTLAIVSATDHLLKAPSEAT
jgi:hypothetical protein